MKTPKITAVDLFCGVGGLTRGLESVGVDVRLGVDVDPVCEYPYKSNNEAKFLRERVEKLKATVVTKALGKAKFRLMAGCAPCQPFSTYRQGIDHRTDDRWSLLLAFARLVRQVRPELVTMENVPGLVRSEVFEHFVSELQELKYWVFARPVTCADYGVPQKRTRLVLLASRLGPIEMIAPTYMPQKYRTVRQAIGTLTPIIAGEASRGDSLHQASGLSRSNLDRIRASRPGGSWRDWHGSLVAKCHKKPTGNSYSGVYGRMSWDEPAPTITTQFYNYGSGRFGHPEQDRALSLREGAILQSFPRKYKFVEAGKNVQQKAIGRLIGNAVPVKLGEAIGRSLLSHVAKYG